MTRLTHALKVTAVSVGSVLGFLIVAAAAIVVFGNTAPGRDVIAALVPRLSGGSIVIEGLTGRFPDRLRMAEVGVQDADGTFSVLNQVRIDWSPSKLLFGEVAVEKFVAADATIRRLPTYQESRGRRRWWPRFVITDIEIPRLTLKKPVAGMPATLRIHGHLELTSSTQGSVTIKAERLDTPGHYDLRFTASPAAIAAAIAIEEPGHGLIGEVAGLPDLGPLVVRAKIAGPPRSVRTKIALSAGPLTAKADGAVDLETHSLKLSLSGSAPAMAPRTGFSWHAAKFEGRVAGLITHPDVDAHLSVEKMTVAGGRVRHLTAAITGTAGTLHLKAMLAHLRIPGPKPDIFAAAPVTIIATAMLREAGRPVVFVLDHPLVAAKGEIDSAGNLQGKVAVRFNSLAPLAALAALDLRGDGRLALTFATQGTRLRVSAKGKAKITGGKAQLVRLLGPETRFTFAGAMQQGSVTVERATLGSHALQASIRGTRKNGVLDFGYKLAFTDLSRLAPKWTGILHTTGTVNGPEDNFALIGKSHGEIGGPRIPKGPVDISFESRHLPTTLSARIKVSGVLAGSPLRLQATVAQNHAGNIELAIQHATWKSAVAEGRIALPPGGLTPTGNIHFRVARLEDAAPFIGAAIGGNMDATLAAGVSEHKHYLRIEAKAQNVTFENSRISRLTIDGSVRDPFADPVLALKLRMDRIAGHELTGGAQIAADGPLDRIRLRLSANTKAKRGPAKVTATATFNLWRRRLDLGAFDANYDDVTAHLLAPAVFVFRDGLVVSDLRLGLGNGVVSASGRLSPKLNFHLSARDLNPALAQLFLPEFSAEGRIAININLRGAWRAPDGSVQVLGRQLRFRNGTSGALPPAEFNARADLAGGKALLDATLSAGPAVQLQVKGSLPLKVGGALALRPRGTIDLTLFNAVLSANGRTLQGKLAVDGRIAGTLAAPNVTGRAEITDGAFRDYVQGVRVTDINGTIEAQGDTLRIVRLTGKAAPGTVSVNGTLKLAKGLPLNLVLTLKNAAPVTTDILTADMDADLKVQGPILQRINVSGSIRIDRAEINIPDSYPTSVAELNVQEPGTALPTARPPWLIGLDLTINAPGQIFVRGHGLTAVMAGRLAIKGTSIKPEINGGFRLQHGQLSIAGQILTLTSGNITFSGRSLTGRLDPAIAFTAETTANNVTATLALTGYADAPRISLTSTPSLPQGDILSQLLFGQNASRLTPFQATQVAQALGSLTGVTGGLDPLKMLRKGLGLDRLSVSSGATPTSGPTIEAGKYITKNIYLGAKQGRIGTTQAELQIDLTKNLKLSATVAAGSTPSATGATPGNDPGSTIGLTYQLEY